MTARMPLRWLVWLGTALLALTLFGLLLDVPAAEGDDRRFWPSLVCVPAILLLADHRPWLAIKLRRGAENGETPCPL
jgi:hypothetical protein